MSDKHSAEASSSEPIVIRENIESLSASLSDQVEMLAGELRTRWKSGQRIGVEQLGRAFEIVVKNEEQLLDLIYHEVLIREEFGEKPKLEDFIARFPQHVDRLQRLFAVHGAIEDDGWDEQLDSAFADDATTMMPGDADRVATPSSTEIGNNSSRKKAHWPRKSRDSRPVEPPPGYELLEEIGRGGMAVVFRAKQQILNRIVALKMLLAGGVASKEVLARIQQEAQAVAQLQHPGIVQIHEVGEHRGLPYLSLEFVSGGTLHSWLNGHPLPPLDAAHMVEQLAQTMQFAHERGVVHRDLKPANVLLSGEWGFANDDRGSSATDIESSKTQNLNPNEARSSLNSTNSMPLHSSLPTLKISDFGLARVLGSRSDLTATGQVIGTPSYMAPEQAAGSSDDVSPAQDIYSLGAILYELLTGRPPFRGATLFDTLEQVRTTDAVPPRQLQPRVPRDLETICLKCLEKSPERRYSTAAAFADDLRRVQLGDTITARPAGPLERSWKLVRRHPAVASLATLTVVMTLAGIAGILRESRKAFESEQQALREKWQAQQQREIADRERDEARAQRLRADEQRLVAEAAQLKAEEQQQLANQARTLAVQAQNQAEASLEQAFQTINTFAIFGYDLRHEPGMQNVSKRLLDSTLKLYDDLAQKQGDTSAARRQRIMALIAAADVRRALRQNEEAEKLFTQAIELLDSELQVSPTEYQLQYLASTIFWPLGVLYKDTDRPRLALEAFQRDLDAHEVMLQQRPNDLDRITGKANILTNMCVAYKDLGKPQEALATYEQAITTLREVLSKSPNHANALSEFGLALHDYSMQLDSMGLKEPALAAHQEAFEVRKKLFARSPNTANYRTFLARSYSSQGAYDRRDGKHDRSIAQYQAAVELLQPLVEKSPDVYEYQLALINTMIQQLSSCTAANNAIIGRRLFEQLSVRLTLAAQKFPQDRKLLGLVASWQANWADFLWEEGQKPKAQLVAKQAIAASLAVLETTPQLTPTEEAGALNTAAWQLTVVPDPTLRNWKQAIELSRRAVELAPTNSYYWHTLGTALYYSGDFSAARDAFLKSLHFDQEPNQRSTPDQFLLAIKGLPDGDFTVIRKEFDKSVGLAKHAPASLALNYSMLAMAFWKTDEKQIARQALRLVVDPPSGFSATDSESRRLIEEARSLITPETTGTKTTDPSNNKP